MADPRDPRATRRAPRRTAYVSGRYCALCGLVCLLGGGIAMTPVYGIVPWWDLLAHSLLGLSLTLVAHATTDRSVVSGAIVIGFSVALETVEYLLLDVWPWWLPALVWSPLDSVTDSGAALLGWAIAVVLLRGLARTAASGSPSWT